MDGTWWKNPQELDDDQKFIVNKLPIDEDHLITGPPGSGKTNILVLRASYLYLQGFYDIAVITYNRTLKEFLSSGIGNYNFAENNIKTYMKWAVEVLLAHGKTVKSEPSNFTERQAFLTDALKELVDSKNSIHKHDIVFLDESQDYSSEQIEIFQTLSNRIFAVGDLQQKIYETKGGLEKLKEFCTLAPPLKYHYRNGRKICRVADTLRDKLDAPDGMESTSQYDEATNESSVDIMVADDIETQAENIAARLEQQLLAYPDERLGVACPRKEELNAVWEVLKSSSVGEKAQLQTYEQGYSALTPDQRIVATTLHGTKGMEFRALHIAGAEKISRFGALQRNLIYTGITRAKTSLTIHHTAPLPGYLGNALGSVQKKPSRPSLDELFKS